MKNKKIVLCVSGSIAAYKSLDLVTALRQQEASVQVVMTDAATRFVTPLSFAALSGNPVLSDMWESGGLSHIDIATSADIVVICPASADVMARLACGLADDLVCATILAATCPIIICPAMNDNMYANVATQHNEQILRERGFLVVSPALGRLASGKTGRGRLASTDEIFKIIDSELWPNKNLRGKSLVITAGGTREPIDAVRFISNRSSGKMGFALALAALKHGATVKLISTVPLPNELVRRVERVVVENTEQMALVTQEACQNADVLIMAAAVSDYKAAQANEHKVKKENQDRWSLDLEKTTDILASAKIKCFKVGFAAETQDLIINAQSKLLGKGLDLIVGNDVSAGKVFDSDETEFCLIDKYGSVREFPQMSKDAAADIILDKISEMLSKEGQ